MRMLATLMIVLLPLHGMALGVSSIVAPAHYHVPLPDPLESEAPQGSPVQLDHDEPHDLAITGVHRHGPVEHADHRDHASGDSTLVPNHHQERGAHDRHHDAGIGHHSHAIEQADVVYLEGDPDRPDLGAAGNHVNASAEAALPARSVPIQAMAGAQVLPDGVGLFVSRETEPPLRPPSARRSRHA